MWKQALDRVWKWDGVGVENDDVLGPRICNLQRFTQRTTLVSTPRGAMQDLEARLVSPLLENLHRLIGRVIDEDDLVRGILEPLQRVEEALDHSLLVVGGDMDGDERVIPEIDVVAVPVAVDPAPAIRAGRTVGAMAVAIARGGG